MMPQQRQQAGDPERPGRGVTWQYGGVPSPLTPAAGLKRAPAGQRACQLPHLSGSWYSLQVVDMSAYTDSSGERLNSRWSTAAVRAGSRAWQAEGGELAAMQTRTTLARGSAGSGSKKAQQERVGGTGRVGGRGAPVVSLRSNQMWMLMTGTPTSLSSRLR